MKKYLLASIALLIASPALAQNPTCPTRPLGDSSNACASTAFVQNNSGGGITPALKPNSSAAFDGTLSATNTTAINAALATGRAVTIPHDANGYSWDSPSIASGQTLICENRATVIYSHSASALNISSLGPETRIENCTIQMAGGPVGSTAFLLKNASAAVNIVTLENVKCLYVYHCVDDEGTANTVAYLTLNRIYTTQTYGTQFRLRSSNGYIILQDINCDFTSEVGIGSVSWGCVDITGFEGVYTFGLLSATGYGTTQVYAAGVPAFKFTVGNVLDTSRIFADTTSGDGILIDTVNYIWGDKLEGSNNFGVQVTISNGTRGNLNSLICNGSIGVTGAAASQTGCDILNQQQLNITSIFERNATGTGVDIRGTSANLNITNLIATSNTGGGLLLRNSVTGINVTNGFVGGNTGTAYLNSSSGINYVALVSGGTQWGNVSAPGSPASGNGALWYDSTDLRFHDKNSAGAIGTTVVADTGAGNNFLTAISPAGVISKAQPTIGNLANINANTILGNWSSSSGAVAANAMPSCSDTGGNHLNYVSGTGVTCGTSTGTASSITVGTTTIASGTTARILYDNAGVLGEYTISGSGTQVAMAIGPSISALVVTSSFTATGLVTSADLRDSGALSVIGRAANSLGVPADISATAASDAVLRESGGVIGFGTIATGGIANNAVTLAKLATQAANTILGNATSGTAVPTALSMTSCSTAASAVIWTTNTGFGCNTSITAAAVPVGGITGLGTGVAAALAINIGSAGAFVTFNGALGTPSSGTLTSATGLPVSTGISGLGTGIATWLATPSSANLAAALTDETGTGPAVFAGSPVFTGTPTWSMGGTAVAKFGATSNYNVFSLNNSIALNGSMGMFGGATGDSTSLYLSSPAAIHFYFAGTDAFNFQNSSAAPTVDDTGATLGDATHRWVQIFAGATDATSTSTGALRVSGGASINKRVWMDGLTAASGTPSSICRNANEITVNATTSCLVSSREWKTNIRPLANLSADLLALKPRLFDWKDASQPKDQIGFIAEEVAETDSRLAVRSKDKWTTWRPEAVTVLLVQGYQSHDVTIRELRQRIEILERTRK